MRIFSKALLTITLSGLTSGAYAQDEASGQNAVTRALKEPLAGIATPVANPRIVPCYSVVDCRAKGRDLETIWQLNDTQKSGDQPPVGGRCPVPAKGGKYAYLHSVC